MSAAVRRRSPSPALIPAMFVRHQLQSSSWILAKKSNVAPNEPHCPTPPRGFYFFWFSFPDISARARHGISYRILLVCGCGLISLARSFGSSCKREPKGHILPRENTNIVAGGPGPHSLLSWSSFSRCVVAFTSYDPFSPHRLPSSIPSWARLKVIGQLI